MITEPIATPDHLEIRDLVADFVTATFGTDRVRAAASSPAGYDDVAWKQMVDLGWTGLGVAASAGGEGLGAVVQCIVHRELGARLAPTPYLATAGFAAAALSTLARPDAAGPLLASIVDGSRKFAVVLGHGSGWPSAVAPPIVAACAEDVWTLTGRLNLQLDVGRADLLLVIAGTHDGWRLFGVRRDDLVIKPRAVPTVDVTRTFADLYLDATPATVLSETLASEDVATLVDRVAVLLAAEMIGAATECLRQTLAYLKTRHQFGRPIGSFQALKHRCADLAVAVTVAQELVFSAAALVESGNHQALSLAAPLALARTGEVFRRASEESIQLHGGVGFTEEVDIGLYYRRALVDVELLASPVDAYARVDAVRGAAR